MTNIKSFLWVTAYKVVSDVCDEVWDFLCLKTKNHCKYPLRTESLLCVVSNQAVILSNYAKKHKNVIK